MRRFLALLLGGTYVILLQASAVAGDCVGASAQTDAFNAVAQCEQQGVAHDAINVGVAAASEVTYSYQPVCERGEGITGDSYFGCGEHVTCGENGHMYTVTAHLPDGSVRPEGQQCFQPDEEPAPAAEVTPGAVLEAFRRIPLPSSEVAVQPPGGETLVNLDTVLSTQAEGFTRTVGLLGRRVELDIRAVEFTWVQGDGTTQVTDWAGRPWRRGSDLARLITHRYDDAARGLDVRVDTTWAADFRVDGGPWRPVPGTVTIEGAAYDLTVLAAEPRLTG